MTKEEFKEARNALGYTQATLAELWGMGKQGGRSIRRWESGEVPICPRACYCLEVMLKLSRKPPNV